MKELTPIQKIIEFIDESAGQMPLEGVLEYAKDLIKEEKIMMNSYYLKGLKQGRIDSINEYINR